MSDARKLDRSPFVCLVILAVAVTLGALCFGAPPRFGRSESLGEPVRSLLEALAPLSWIHVSTALVLTLLLVAEVLRRGRVGLGGGKDARRRRLPLVLLIALGVVQLIPLPLGLLGLLPSHAAQTWASLTPDGDTTWRTLSLWPHGTWNGLFVLAGMLAAQAAVGAAVRESRRRAVSAKGRPALTVGILVLVFVVVVATLECAYGLYETKLAGDTVLGAGKTSNVGRVTGTFIQSAMLAVWAGMGACCALALAVAAVIRGGRVAAWSAPLLVSMTVCGAGGLYSLSRLGLGATAVALFVAAVMLSVAAWRAGRVVTGHLLRAVALFVPVAAVAAALLVPAVRERIDFLTQWLLGAETPQEPRVAMWRSAWDLFTESPLIGSGLGAFERSIHLVQSTDSPLEMHFAHSEPLNLLTDVGVVGLGLAVWWVLGHLGRGRRSLVSTDPTERAVSIGACCAALVVLLVALADFQTQFPVVAVPFAALLALPSALGARQETLSDRQEGPDTDGGIAPHRRPMVAGVYAVGFVVLAGWSALSVNARFEHVRSGLPPAATRAERHLAKGIAAFAGAKGSSDPAAELETAYREMRTAANLDPMLDAAHQWQGMLSLALRKERNDVLRQLGRARTVCRGHADVSLVVGGLYLDLIGTEEAPYGPDGDSALVALREAGALAPGAFVRAWELARDRVLSVDELKQIVPDRAHALRKLASHLQRQGLPKDALTALARAVEVEPRDSMARVDYGFALLDGGAKDEAVTQLRTVLSAKGHDTQVAPEVARRFRAVGEEELGRIVFTEAQVPWPE